MTNGRPVIQPSTLGKFIDLESCPQFFKFNIEGVGFDALNHEKDDFTEAFHGGNIIEREAGNQFEENVIDIISEYTETVIDIESLTLATAVEAVPSAVSNSFPNITENGTEKSVYNTKLSAIPLGKIDEAYDKISENNASDVDIEKQELKDALYDVRVTYTRKLLKEISANIDKEHIGEHVSIPLSNTDTTPDSDEDIIPLTQTKRDISDPVVLFQPAFKTTIGEWDISGDADLIFIWPTNPNPTVRVVDVKLATEEKTDHQLQTVTYTSAIENFEFITDSNITVEAGVLTKATSFTPLTPDVIPKFDKDSRTADLQRLTKAGGRLDKLYEKDYEDTSFQLNDKCSTCQYNEACYTMAIEEKGLQLLDIDKGMQEKLRDKGIDTITDLADIAKEIEKPKPVKTEKPKPIREHRETYEELATIPGLGEKLPQLIQQAQRYAEIIEPSAYNLNKNQGAKSYVNSGYGELPDEKYINNSTESGGEIIDGSMIKVTMNIQYDHIRDCIITIGAHISAEASTTQPMTVSHTLETTSDDLTEVYQHEKELLETFIEDVYDRMKAIENGIDFSGSQQENPLIHFYTYSKDELTVLQERLTEYAKDEITITDELTKQKQGVENDITLSLQSPAINSFRNILGYRKGSEEQMVSAVLTDIDNRFATQAPTNGLINVYREFGVAKNWKYEPVDSSRLPDGQTEVDLQNVFGYRFFNNIMPFSEDNDSINILHNSSISSDDWYTTRVRTAAQIPIAYLWSATGKIDASWGNVNDKYTNITIYPFLYHDNAERNVKITTEDTEMLVEKMCTCLHNLQDNIWPTANVTVTKQAVNKDDEEVIQTQIPQ